MSPNETRTLWISVGLAIVAMILFYSYSQENKAELDNKYGAKQTVVVAAQNINAMATINESMLTLKTLPQAYVQPGSVNDPELVVDQVAAAPIKKGEQVLKTNLLSPGPLTGISMQIAPERRAMDIPIDDIRGVGKLVKPGDRVDIIAALDYGSGANTQKEVRTILQDVPVLATGVQIVNNIPRLVEKDGNNPNRVNIVPLTGDTSYKDITVEVTPKEAQQLILILATSPGGLYVTLRNPNDRLKNELPTTTVNTVLNTYTPAQIMPQFRNPSSYVPPAPPPPAKRINRRPHRRSAFQNL